MTKVIKISLNKKEIEGLAEFACKNDLTFFQAIRLLFARAPYLQVTKKKEVGSHGE